MATNVCMRSARTIRSQFSSTMQNPFVVRESLPCIPLVFRRRQPHVAGHAGALLLCALFPLAGLLATQDAQAQIKTVPDGRWRHILGAGASVASGNSDLTSFNAHYDTARETGRHSLAFKAKALYSTSEGETAAHNFNLETNGKRNLTPEWYVFANGAWFRDRIANLSHRLTAASGIGFRVKRTPKDDWSVFAGVGYSEDRYAAPTLVDDRIRTRYGRAEANVGTESHHQLTATTTAHQRFVVYPAMNGSGDVRAELLANISVAITRRLALTATAELRYNSDPGTAISTMDRRFTTGVTLKFID